MKQNILEFYDTLEKALDRAVWLQFQYRNVQKQFVVYDGPEDNYAVSDVQTAEEMEIPHQYYPLPENYENLSYEKLQAINKDDEPLVHWEELLGRFATMEGEILRFILAYKIPLEKLIRNELANRGFDANNQWIGFDASKEFWLTDETKEKL